MDQKSSPGSRPNSNQNQNLQSRVISDKLSIYYSNCAMVATSPVDIAIIFGRYVQANDQSGAQGLAELYERQIYMTLEQAKRLGSVLNQTIQALEAQEESANRTTQNTSHQVQRPAVTQAQRPQPVSTSTASQQGTNSSPKPTQVVRKPPEGNR